jgi:hypothetical protein
VSARTPGGQIPGGQIPIRQIPVRQIPVRQIARRQPCAGASAQASNRSNVIVLFVPFRSGTRTRQLKCPPDGAATRNERRVGFSLDAARHPPWVTAREHMYLHS